MKNAGTSRNYAGPWRRTPGRVFAIALVRLYQLTLSGFVGGHCRHLPTCSEYAYEAVALYGFFPGGWLAAKRIARCGPFGTSGLDPVPKRAARKSRGSDPSPVDPTAVRATFDKD